MANLERFTRTFSDPPPGTGVELSTLGLSGLSFLKAFADHVGTGVFMGGAISVSSVREAAIDIVPWRHLVPAESRYFATNCIGELFFIAPDHKLHFVMVHDADTTELQTTPDEFFGWITDPRNMSRYVAIQQFDAESRKLQPTQLLTYEPPVALGGAEVPDHLVPVEAKDGLKRLADIHFRS